MKKELIITELFKLHDKSIATQKARRDTIRQQNRQIKEENNLLKAKFASLKNYIDVLEEENRRHKKQNEQIKQLEDMYIKQMKTN